MCAKLGPREKQILFSPLFKFSSALKQVPGLALLQVPSAVTETSERSQTPTGGAEAA